MARHGDLNYLKGFIVNKLYCHGCWVGRRVGQIKHHTEMNLRSEYNRRQLRLWERQ